MNFVGDSMLGRVIDQMYETHVEDPETNAVAVSFQRNDEKLELYNDETPWAT